MQSGSQSHAGKFVCQIQIVKDIKIHTLYQKFINQVIVLEN